MIATFICFNWSRLPGQFHENPVYGTFFGLGLATTVCLLLSGSEEIVLDGQATAVDDSQKFPGMAPPREYPFSDIDALAAREPRDRNPDGLSCRWRGRTVTFGKGVNQKQADLILSELQKALPGAAPKLLAGGGPLQEHFIALNLWRRHFHRQVCILSITLPGPR